MCDALVVLGQQTGDEGDFFVVVVDCKHKVTVRLLIFSSPCFDTSQPL